MANRYATVAYHYRNTVSGKDEHVPMGVLRDSLHQSVVQNAALFASSPLQPPAVTGVLQSYLIVYPNGYVT